MNKQEIRPFFLGDPVGNIERDCPELLLNEWLLLCDILNGTIRCPELADCLDLELHKSKEDGMGAKWMVDIDSFTRIIMNMSHDERCAIIDVIEQFWKHPKRRDVDVLTVLRLVGAKVYH